MIKAAVVGSTGYSGQELVDLILRNSQAELVCVTARSEAGMKYSEIYPRFAGRTDLVCMELDVEAISSMCDCVFLALPHTVSMDVAPAFLEKGIKVIDLSADYRIPEEFYPEWYQTEHSNPENIEKAVYGLPEMNREKIKNADLIANPGCYPTSVILGLLPVAGDVAEKSIIVDSKSGASGAGRKASITLSFSEVDEDFKCYKANEHQHIPEMEHKLSDFAGKDIKINFTPHLLPVKRGILSTMYISADGLGTEAEILKKFEDYYKEEPFVRVRPAGSLPAIQDVTGTNFCDVGVKVARGMLVIVSVIDNLVKGASGQAMQNMNIMFGIDEKEGLI